MSHSHHSGGHTDPVEPSNALLTFSTLAVDEADDMVEGIGELLFGNISFEEAHHLFLSGRVNILLDVDLTLNEIEGFLRVGFTHLTTLLELLQLSPDRLNSGSIDFCEAWYFLKSGGHA